MKIIIVTIFALYLSALAYIYLTQDAQIFNASGVDKNEPLKLEGAKEVKFEVQKGVILDGVYKKSIYKNAPLIIYFGGNADDATRILLYTKTLKDYDLITFNYRGYLKSTGRPSQKALFSDALSIYDEYAKNKKVIVIGRSLGTGVATYLASERKTNGVILITPYNSISEIAQKKYPYFPIALLIKHKFNSYIYTKKIKTPISLIEVNDDKTIPDWSFKRLKNSINHLSLHVKLFDTTHGDVLKHKDFEKTLHKMIEKF